MTTPLNGTVVVTTPGAPGNQVGTGQGNVVITPALQGPPGPPGPPGDGGNWSSITNKPAVIAAGADQAAARGAIGTLSQSEVDARVTTVGANAYAPRWQPNETLTAGTARLLPIARVGTFKADGTTGATFDATKWNYPRLTFTGTTTGAPTADIPGATVGDIYVDSAGNEYTLGS